MAEKEYQVQIKSKEPDSFEFDRKVKGHTYTTVKKVKASSEDEAKKIATKEFKSSKVYQKQKDNIPSSFETPSGKPIKPRVSTKIYGGGGGAGSGTLKQLKMMGPTRKFKKGGLAKGFPKLALKGF
jgi:hypothetical protein